MPLVPTSQIMQAAVAGGYGQGAFNVIHLETAQALVSGAEQAGLPVILQISENCVKYHGRLRPIAAASLALAEEASVPVSLHLDHAEDEELVYRALDLGFGSVMYDGAKLPFGENVAATQRVVAAARAASATVEAELGEIGGKDGAHAPGVRTDPDEAVQFVELTGIDSLAVAVGSSHAMLERGASLDLDLISRLHRALEVPLVLHGSSGVPDATLVAGIEAGMRKINVSTHLNGFFTRAVRQWLAANEQAVDSRKYLGAGRTAMAAEAARMLELFASAGRSRA
ncbi:fructose-bisphosphate aldolase [Arthrobacter sp. YC-RL1]|uniref:class II fructose-bisphosphate aldolase n=1 Tax=Arthrobacter sp. YC-RL1 TaxID=1652545 RepID=UPI00063DABBB|nr:class II fructose-bisphosphate aldolase [Arthrobacter sp. YC-RL1]ALQ31480.1 fructose-bisphosphate aldolase [Arthrobacter sp. YC-RL1]KLI90038.1 fructose-bisphosphate aldolase [Arthrobacter sp. YC-RL1]